MRLITLLSMAPVALLTAPTALAAPTRLPVQGALSNLAGPVPDGSYGMAISLYAAGNATTPLYTETHLALPVADGLFSISLGGLQPLDDSLFAPGGAAFVGVTVGGDPELQRVSLGTTPYAHWANRAGSAHDLSCDGCVGAGQLAQGSVGAAKLAPELAGLAMKEQANLWTGLQTFGGGTDFAAVEARRFRLQNSAAAPVPCDSSSLGVLYYDTVRSDVLVCTGSAWRSLVNIASLGSVENPATSCHAILVAGVSLGSGVYHLRTSYSPTPFKVFCDMETHGGGWTRVANVRADQHLCAYTENGTETDLLTDTGSTGIMAPAKAATIEMSQKQVLAYISPAINDVFTSSNANFTWPNIATGTIHTYNVQNYGVSASRAGGAFLPVTGPAHCANGACMLGGYTDAPASQWTVILGIGSHDIGSFTQNTTCTASTSTHKGMYSGAPNHQWSQKGAVYIR